MKKFLFFIGLGLVFAIPTAESSSDDYEEPIIRLGQNSTILPADFSARNYMMAYSDLQQAWSGLPLQVQIDRARAHYLARHAENPRIALSKKFNPFIYLVLNPDILQDVRRRNLSKNAIESTALQHYINSGLQRRRPYYVPDLHMDDLLPSGLPRYFSSDLYLQAYPDVANVFRHLSGDGLRQAAINHYLNSGRYAGRIPFTLLFNGALYVQSNPDLQLHVRQHGISDVNSWGLKHFRDGGIRKNRRCFPLDFHPDAYRCMYQDLVEASRSSYNKRIWATVHYATGGFNAGRAYVSREQTMLQELGFSSEKAMTALSVITDFDMPRWQGLRLWLVMGGLRNPNDFRYPDDACGIRGIIGNENALNYSEQVARDCVMKLYNFSQASNITFEEAIQRSFQFRANYQLQDDCSLGQALSILLAVEARANFAQEGQDACEAKFNQLGLDIRWRRAPVIAGVNFETDLNNCMFKVAELGCRWDRNPIKLNVQRFLRNPALYIYSDSELDALAEVSEDILRAKIHALEPFLDETCRGAFKNGSSDGALTQKFLSRPDFRKRINRFCDRIPALMIQGGTAESQRHANELFANLLYNTFYSRCDTGVGDGLDHLEREFNLRKANITNPECEIFAKVGGLLIDYVDDVIDKHADIDAGAEYKTTCAHILRQRLRIIFPRGQYEVVAYASLGNPYDAQNQPATVLEKIINGGDIISPAHSVREVDQWGWGHQREVPEQVKFHLEPLTVRRLVDMVYACLDNDELANYCSREPTLFKSLNDATYEMVSNAFFECGVNGKGFYKKTVCVPLLLELGLIEFRHDVSLADFSDGGTYDEQTLEQLIDNN